MPTYDFKCCECATVFEQNCSWKVNVMSCPKCTGFAPRQLSAPAGIRMGDGRALRKANRIKEPIWRYPDGHIESLNSANTRPEE